MPPRLTRPGALAYLAVTGGLAVQAVRIIRDEAIWSSGQAWAAACILLVVVLTGGLFGIATVTRRPLIADDGPLLSRAGWVVVVGLTAFAVVVVMMSSLDAFGVWPNSPAIFVPFWVRKLEEAYYEGVQEARLAHEAARAAEPGNP